MSENTPVFHTITELLQDTDYFYVNLEYSKEEIDTEIDTSNCRGKRDTFKWSQDGRTVTCRPSSKSFEQVNNRFKESRKSFQKLLNEIAKQHCIGSASDAIKQRTALLVIRVGPVGSNTVSSRLIGKHTIRLLTVIRKQQCRMYQLTLPSSKHNTLIFPIYRIYLHASKAGQV